MEEKRLKIAIFGGSFNPPHKGHLAALRALIKEMKIDIIYVVPCKTPLLGKEKTENISDTDIFAMSKLTFGQKNNVRVIPYELQSENKSYSYLTVEHVKNLHPNSIIMLFIGTDQLLLLEKWKNAEYLFAECAFIVADRENKNDGTIQQTAEYLKKKYRAKILFLNYKSEVMSSTEIRKKLKANIECDELTKRTMNYIKQNKLYGLNAAPKNKEN